MKRLSLSGVNSLNEQVKLNKHVVKFITDDNYMSITMLNFLNLELVTPKGTYNLQRNPKLNIYQGNCNGHKVHVSLKKIVGEIRYW